MKTIDTAQRVPAVAGRFYPGSAARLQEDVRGYLAANAMEPLMEVRGVIAPHAGYPCSGPIAGAAFRALQRLLPAERTVYLLGPAHHKAVHGVALSGAQAFLTPLGQVPVAVDRVAELLAFGRSFHLDDMAHAPEHCLEVELPFLQVVLPAFRIVPMLFDDGAEPERIASILVRALETHPDDLVVVSSDLSHYRPYEDAVAVDYALLKAIATRDLDAANVGEACGIIPILVLMNLAELLNWQPHLLAYGNSGDTCGPRREVVGYGAVCYTAE